MRLEAPSEAGDWIWYPHVSMVIHGLKFFFGVKWVSAHLVHLNMDLAKNNINITLTLIPWLHIPWLRQLHLVGSSVFKAYSIIDINYSKIQNISINSYYIDLPISNVVHPPKQTWNLKMGAPWKRRFLLETIISRFHVNFWGCSFLENSASTKNKLFGSTGVF